MQRLTKKMTFTFKTSCMKSFLELKVEVNEYFQISFSRYLHLIVKNTNLHATHDKMNTRFRVRKDDMKTFLELSQ